MDRLFPIWMREGSLVGLAVLVAANAVLCFIYAAAVFLALRLVN